MKQKELKFNMLWSSFTLPPVSSRHMTSPWIYFCSWQFFIGMLVLKKELQGVSLPSPTEWMNSFHDSNVGTKMLQPHILVNRPWIICTILRPKVPYHEILCMHGGVRMAGCVCVFMRFLYKWVWENEIGLFWIWFVHVFFILILLKDNILHFFCTFSVGKG